MLFFLTSSQLEILNESAVGKNEQEIRILVSSWDSFYRDKIKSLRWFGHITLLEKKLLITKISLLIPINDYSDWKIMMVKLLSLKNH